jgi:hypothetical protein
VANENEMGSARLLITEQRELGLLRNDASARRK